MGNNFESVSDEVLSSNYTRALDGDVEVVDEIIQYQEELRRRFMRIPTIATNIIEITEKSD